MTVTRVKAQGSKNLDHFLKESGNNLSAQIGWFESAKYDDGTPVAYIASIQEFGSAKNNIPPRSFMRTTVKERSSEWAGASEKVLSRVASGKASMNDLFDIVGQLASANIREKIKSIHQPALKDATVKSRLSKKKNGKVIGLLEKPLIESATLLNTLTNVVSKK